MIINRLAREIMAAMNEAVANGLDPLHEARKDYPDVPQGLLSECYGTLAAAFVAPPKEGDVPAAFSPRDQFAAAALTGFLASDSYANAALAVKHPEEVARHVYLMVDAMLAVRGRS